MLHPRVDDTNRGGACHVPQPLQYLLCLLNLFDFSRGVPAKVLLYSCGKREVVCIEARFSAIRLCATGEYVVRRRSGDNVLVIGGVISDLSSRVNHLAG